MARFGKQGGVDRLDDADFAVSLVELDGAFAESEERPIAADAYASTGVVLGAALADDDAAGEYFFAAEDLHAQTLGAAVAAVAG